ncbi:MAG: hypothetical protein IPH81_18295 [Candidatus Microthrix sp.]|nr:hypothetical protein [Candidatus Microthrix sp.]
MRPRFRSLLPLVMLAMLLAPAEAGAAGPGGTITVTPATGLVDGQVVTVTGTGLPPGTELEIFQCRAGAVDESGCSGSVAFDLATDNVGGSPTPSRSMPSPLVRAFSPAARVGTRSTVAPVRKLALSESGFWLTRASRPRRPSRLTRRHRFGPR